MDRTTVPMDGHADTMVPVAAYFPIDLCLGTCRYRWLRHQEETKPSLGTRQMPGLSVDLLPSRGLQPRGKMLGSFSVSTLPSPRRALRGDRKEFTGSSSEEGATSWVRCHPHCSLLKLPLSLPQFTACCGNRVGALL